MRGAGAWCGGGFAFILCFSPTSAKSASQLIELTQVPCQFLESEGDTNLGYQSRTAKDCEAINAATGKNRLVKARALVLKPGRYVFRVENKNVPYELGFWLRPAGGRGPSVSGGGLLPGKYRDYEIVLKPGEYIYSCPLNPTPDYRLVVR